MTSLEMRAPGVFFWLGLHLIQSIKQGGKIMTLAKKLWKKIETNTVKHSKRVLNGEAESILPLEFHEEIVNLHNCNIPLNNHKER